MAAEAHKEAAADYLYKNSVPQLFEDMMASLTQHQPADPVGHLISFLDNRKNRGTDNRVIFVLGGPGSGKGTVCARLVQQYGCKHLSAGDLLREEQQRPESKYGSLISECIRNGKIVPKEITIGLLKQAMERECIGTTFLIDGFPRAMDQAVAFENDVTRCAFVLFIDCPEDVMETRLLKRGETSGRSDDNIESIRKRFKTYVTQTMPVIEYFDKDNRVRKVSGILTPEQVFAEVQKLM